MIEKTFTFIQSFIQNLKKFLLTKIKGFFFFFLQENQKEIAMRLNYSLYNKHHQVTFSCHAEILEK